MRDSLFVRGTRRRLPSRLQAIGNGAIDESRLPIMMGEEFGLGLDDSGHPLCDRSSDTAVELSKRRAQEASIGSILHKRVLEDIGRLGWSSPGKDQLRRAELVERVLECRAVNRRHGIQ